MMHFDEMRRMTELERTLYEKLVPILKQNGLDHSQSALLACSLAYGLIDNVTDVIANKISEAVNKLK